MLEEQLLLQVWCVGVAASSPVGCYNNVVTIVNDIRKKIDLLKANDPEVCGCYSRCGWATPTLIFYLSGA